MKRDIIALITVIALASVPGSKTEAQSGYAPASVLSTGKWLKIGITETGIYRIDYSKLKQAGLQYPGNPRVFGNNRGQLSYYNNAPRPDDLKEISVWYSKGQDGVFNEGDYLLFFASSTHRFIYNKSTGDFDFLRHNYSDTAFYFITSMQGTGKTVSDALQPSGTANYFSNETDLLFSYETEGENLIKSGREWYQPVSVYNPQAISTTLANLLPGEPVQYKIRVLGRSSIPTLFRLQEGETVITELSVPEVYLLSTTGTYARDAIATGSFVPATSPPSFQVRFINNGESAARGWLDYVRLKARARAIYSGTAIELTDTKTTGTGRITDFSVTSPTQNIQIWDITDPDNPANVQYSRNGDDCRFKAPTDSLRKYFVFSLSNVKTPVFRNSEVANQNLHGSDETDMVIVTHPMFLSYSQKLAALHNANSGLKTVIVTPEQVYNEFSGGIPDAVAIRNFLRMKYEKQLSGSKLKYLLLFGDGSYENKTPPPRNPNFIPTYQSLNSTVIVSSFTSDDFYGLLEPGEGEADGTEDLGIGRFPVADTVSAGIMVEKVRKYLGVSAMGDWRNTVAIVADDEDGNAHSYDAEGLYTLLNNDNPQFNVEKIYLDAFRQVTSVNGQSYPDVTRAINDRINAGCLVFNYLGHGNEIGLAHERVVKTENINSWKNGARLPLFITATCEFSRYDDIEINMVTREMTGKNSAGEMVLLNRDGGGIALMTTTRVVYSAPNYTLNRNIYSHAFDRDENGEAIRLGDIIRRAKISSGNGMNKRNFQLLGDPAVRLAWPWHGEVVTDSINHISIALPTDTLKALSVITVSGHIADTSGNINTDFTGTVNATVYDKVSEVRTLANDGGPAMDFEMRNNIIFSGRTRAEGGRFSFTFIVPKDIRYSYGKGKISYYASGGGKDMNGQYTGITVGGFSDVDISDNSGPEIRLFLNDTLFRNGGMTGSEPVLLAIISDSSGINTTGSGIGHDLTAWIDNERNKSFELNGYYETEINDFRKGRLSYPLSELVAGRHILTLKAWDNLNNSSEESISFIVRGEEGFILNNLINYPNPFSEETNISAEHNRPDEDLEIRIEIYSSNGLKVKIIETEVTSTGFRLPPVTWDGNDENGGRVTGGLYIYTVTVTTSKGEKAKASGRMIIL